jgi:hypothetical protein
VSVFATACGAGQSNDEDEGGGGNAAEVEGDTTGITDDTIKLGTHKPLTGPVAPGYSEISTGQQAYFDYVNANGGVCEREIEYVVRDDATTHEHDERGQPARPAGPGLRHLPGPGHADAQRRPRLPQRRAGARPVRLLRLQAVEPAGGVPLHLRLAARLHRRGQGHRAVHQGELPDAKVGLFLQGDELGADGAEGVKQILDEEQIVAEVEYVTTNTDVGPQVSELQQAGADFVIGFNVPPSRRSATSLPSG